MAPPPTSCERASAVLSILPATIMADGRETVIYSPRAGGVPGLRPDGPP